MDRVSGPANLAFMKRGWLWLFPLAGLVALGIWSWDRKPAPEAPPLSAPPARKAGTPAWTDPLPMAGSGLDAGRVPPGNGALKGQRIVRIPGNLDVGTVVTRARKLGLKVMGGIPGLRMVRFGVDESNPDPLRRLMEEFPGLEAAENHAVGLLRPPSMVDDKGAAIPGFGASWIQALGISGVDVQWGKGVTVAVLDTGIAPHLVFEGRTWKSIDLLPDSPAGSGHGTAVSSLIVAHHPQLPGIAPSADLLGVRVLDAQGTGDAFTVAEGIVRAVDAGANILNLSLGSDVDNTALREAVRYALDRGVVVVAAAGNDGRNGLVYPAGYEGVVAVGASDAELGTASFSNRGKELDILAPGVAIPAAYAEKMAVSMSGTSASTAVFSGAVAALMSKEPGLGAQAAASVLISQADEAGEPGPDVKSGKGMLDLEAALRRKDRQFSDAMVASSFLSGGARADGAVPWTVVVQNCGNTFLQGGQVALQVGYLTLNGWVPALSSRQTHAVQFWLYPSARTGKEAVVTAKIILGQGGDSRPGNDVLETVWR